MARHAECIWAALAMGEEKAVRGMDTSDFDWRSLHPAFGSPLHAVLFGRIRASVGGEAEQDSSFGDILLDEPQGRKSRLALLRLVMANGADPYAAAPPTCNLTAKWEETGATTPSITFGGKSALECLLDVKRAIRQFGNTKWSDERKAIEVAIDILSAPPSRSSVTVPVSEGICDIWERVLGDTDSADVTLLVEAAPGQEEVRLKAHLVVLRAASPVLKAMLGSGNMREASNREVPVPGCGAQALQLLLALIYTGTAGATDKDPTVPTMLAALDLAHRWQVLSVTHILERAVAQRVDMTCVEAAMDMALRLQLQTLLSACRTFVSNHAQEMEAKIAKIGSLAVRGEFERILNKPTQEPRKKQRRLL